MDDPHGNAGARTFTASCDGAGDDVGLLRRIGQGDESAMAAFYHEHGRVVLGQVLLVAGERALAEEIATGEVPVRASLRCEVRDALDQLVRRAQRAGALRTDVTADDIKLLLSGLAQATVAAGDEGSLDRFIRVMLDGLRPAAVQRRRRTP